MDTLIKKCQNYKFQKKTWKKIFATWNKQRFITQETKNESYKENKVIN